MFVLQYVYDISSNRIRSVVKKKKKKCWKKLVEEMFARRYFAISWLNFDQT